MIYFVNYKQLMKNAKMNYCFFKHHLISARTYSLHLLGLDILFWIYAMFTHTYWLHTNKLWRWVFSLSVINRDCLHNVLLRMKLKKSFIIFKCNWQFFNFWTSSTFKTDHQSFWTSYYKPLRNADQEIIFNSLKHPRLIVFYSNVRN